MPVINSKLCVRIGEAVRCTTVVHVTALHPANNCRRMLMRMPLDCVHDVIRYFRSSAEGGSSMGQYNYGRMLVEGNGVKGDKVRAVQWWLKAAKQGNALAMYPLGCVYLEGEVVPQDDKKALKWWKLAAAGEHPCPAAQSNIATMYLRGGIGVPKDELKALAYFQRAAAQGDAQG